MPTIVSFKHQVAVTPFPKTGVTAVVKDGFAKAAQKSGVEALTVVFGNSGELSPGDVVYVKGDGVASWGRDEYEVDGKKFVMCPIERIILVKKQPLVPPPVPKPTSAPVPGTVRATG